MQDALQGERDAAASPYKDLRSHALSAAHFNPFCVR